ncbi:MULTISPECIES: mycoredoxin [Protofrankia]|uniref:Glutaredoxin n=1 Tax=Protofrankia coriariae TaxID=1562887 RepID=A0ABR5F8E2_9ACTN|nr:MULTISPECIES: mycoredoxin [Protofrankia]KLL12998.1 glutaredoxin [Protofrankia coriariae]ONH38259.1 glutaredoxin-like protein [Protofrankia sp. BMG5.30]
MPTIYTTSWCGYCTRLKRQLDQAGIPYETIDIEQNPEAEQIVRAVNNGNATVPTVVFEDGTALTNPSLRQVTEKTSSAA